MLPGDAFGNIFLYTIDNQGATTQGIRYLKNPAFFDDITYTATIIV